MRQTWRWFGPNDRVSVDEMMQAGVEGVVSALHHVPTGDVWTLEDIEQRQAQIGRMRDGSPSHLKWEVVESLPVSEDVKRQSGDWRSHIENWRRSLRNLKTTGIEVVCYNFMPVLDWTRTDLGWRLPNGATCMRFDMVDFAVFDIHLLARAGASETYPEHIRCEAGQRFRTMPETRKKALVDNVVCGLPGAAESFTLEDIKEHLERYRDMGEELLRRHLVDFLSEVTPLAEELGMRLCCHPDDPPFPLLGLPRVMSTESQYRSVLEAVDLTANGVTLCSGSLGARPDNDLPGMMERFGERVHFLHLRNVRRESDDIVGSFYEAEHLGGGTDMVALLAAAVREENRRRAAGNGAVSIPFRPDHGQEILDDHNRKAQPGYPAIGRLKGLAELRGIIAALTHRDEGIAA